MNISVKVLSAVLLEFIIFPNSICEVIVIKEKSIIFAVKIFSVELTIGHCHRSHLLDLSGSLLWVETCHFSLELSVLTMGSLHLFIIVQFFFVRGVYRILFIIFIHNFKVNLIVNLKSSHFYFLLPHFIMELNIIENSIYKTLNIWIFIA